MSAQHELVRPRPPIMPTMELWERPLFAALLAYEFTVMMVSVVREFFDVFPDNLSLLPSDREIEFGIDLIP